jgi:hypothetical protein
MEKDKIHIFFNEVKKVWQCFNKNGEVISEHKDIKDAVKWCNIIATKK